MVENGGKIDKNGYKLYIFRKFGGNLGDLLFTLLHITS